MAGVTDKAVKRTLEAVKVQALQEAPHDEGVLQSTIQTNVEDGKGIIHAGGGPGTEFPRVPYAIRWHEKDANFQKGRKKRYIADPFNRIAEDRLRKEMRKEGRNKL